MCLYQVRAAGLAVQAIDVLGEYPTDPRLAVASCAIQRWAGSGWAPTIALSRLPRGDSHVRAGFCWNIDVLKAILMGQPSAAVLALLEAATRRDSVGSPNWRIGQHR